MISDLARHLQVVALINRWTIEAERFFDRPKSVQERGYQFGLRGAAGVG